MSPEDVYLDPAVFREVARTGEDVMWGIRLSDGSQITVLDRMTGFGWRDVETGYKAPDGRFWLASGNFDIRTFVGRSYRALIGYIKANSNTCVGANPPKRHPPA